MCFCVEEKFSEHWVKEDSLLWRSKCGAKKKKKGNINYFYTHNSNQVYWGIYSSLFIWNVWTRKWIIYSKVGVETWQVNSVHDFEPALQMGFKSTTLWLGHEPTIPDLGGDSNPLSFNWSHPLTGAQILLSHYRKNSAGYKVAGKEWVFWHRTLVRDTGGQTREHGSKNKEGYMFIIPKKK